MKEGKRSSEMKSLPLKLSNIFRGNCIMKSFSILLATSFLPYFFFQTQFYAQVGEHLKKLSVYSFRCCLLRLNDSDKLLFFSFWSLKLFTRCKLWNEICWNMVFLLKEIRVSFDWYLITRLFPSVLQTFFLQRASMSISQAFFITKQKEETNFFHINCVKKSDLFGNKSIPIEIHWIGK